jgi:charged multivesicular body protein 4
MYEAAREVLHSSLEPSEVINLYRVLVKRDVDPDLWDSQLRFWSSIIKRWGDRASVLDFSVSELTTALMYDELCPPLQPALNLLVNLNVLQSRDSALAPPSIATSIAGRVLGFIFPVDPPPSESYVFRTALRERANQIVQAITTRPGLITDLCCTKEYLATQDPTVSVDLICAEFDRMKRTVEKRPLGYFFPCPAFRNPAREVIDGVLKIKVGMARLSATLEKLQNEIDVQLERAREFKGQNRHDQAIMCLQRKKRAEVRATRVSGALRQLENALDQIETGDMNAQTAEAMRRASKVPVLDREDVEKVMDEAAEYMAKQKELSDAFQLPQLDDDELERELDEIAAQSQPIPATSTKTAAKVVMRSV